MQSITIDIINEKAITLLKDLEALKLISLRKDKLEEKPGTLDWAKYKGAMSKQPLVEIDQQLNELRNDRE